MSVRTEGIVLSPETSREVLESMVAVGEFFGVPVGTSDRMPRDAIGWVRPDGLVECEPIPRLPDDEDGG